MNWTDILKTFLTSCIPAILAYFGATSKNKYEINKLNTIHQAEIDKIRIEHENKLLLLEKQAEIEKQQLLNVEMAKLTPEIMKLFMSTPEVNSLILNKIKHHSK